MRVVFGESGPGLGKTLCANDVLIVPSFCSPSLYEQLRTGISELQENGEIQFALRHGRSRLIIENPDIVPLFNEIINKMAMYMDVNQPFATRLNFYQTPLDCKPLHQDATASNENLRRCQNITIGLSLGAERELVFRHLDSGVVNTFKLPSGSLYSFGNNVNLFYEHGVLRPSAWADHPHGRISLMIWGRSMRVSNELVPQMCYAGVARRISERDSPSTPCRRVRPRLDTDTTPDASSRAR
eukprot:12402304-Karenia_brevis.AAC.1